MRRCATGLVGIGEWDPCAWWSCCGDSIANASLAAAQIDSSSERCEALPDSARGSDEWLSLSWSFSTRRRSVDSSKPYCCYYKATCRSSVLPAVASGRLPRCVPATPGKQPHSDWRRSAAPKFGLASSTRIEVAYFHPAGEGENAISNRYTIRINTKSTIQNMYIFFNFWAIKIGKTISTFTFNIDKKKDQTPCWIQIKKWTIEILARFSEGKSANVWTKKRKMFE